MPSFALTLCLNEQRVSALFLKSLLGWKIQMLPGLLSCVHFMSIQTYKV